MKFSNGDLVKFSPWGMEYPGLGIVINNDPASDDEWSGYEISVLGRDRVDPLQRAADEGAGCWISGC